jgi:hypothetical protein
LRGFAETGRVDAARAAALLALLLLTGCSGGSLVTPATTASTPATTASTPGATASPAAATSAAASPAPAAAPAPAPAPAPTPSLKEKIASFFSGATQKDPQPVANGPTDVACPFLDIRQGASTLTIPPPPPDGANEAMSLKYQGTLVRAARDCGVVNGQMVMRVGVQGRIIVGPAGGPGQVDVPLRIAVVAAPLTTPRTLVTKLIRIPVMIGPSDAHAEFTHIEEGVTFPMPPPDAVDPYLVYIGFDPMGAAAQDQAKKPAPVKKPKPNVKPNPNAPTG